MNKYISYCMLLCLLTMTSCLGVITVNTKKALGIVDDSGTSGSGGAGPGSAQLLSASFTKNTSSSVSLSCGSNTHYMVSATQPLLSDGGWTACSSGTFTISQSLTLGNNDLKYWFKDSASVTATSQDLNVWSGVKYFGSNTPVAGGMFGVQGTNFLTPTRILAVDGMNSHVASGAGAVFIYDEVGNLIKAIYGEYAGENFGGTTDYSRGNNTGDTVKLSNGNFVVVAPNYDNGAITNAGAFFIYNSNGDELGRHMGDEVNDNIGNQGVKELSNGNFIVTSTEERVAGISRAGSVRVFNGTTGALIATISGTVADDQYGSYLPFPLSNGNFIVHSGSKTVGGVPGVGSIDLVNGTTGAVIASYDGANTSDLSAMLLSDISNGNFIIGLPNFSTGVYSLNGKAMLINASTGAVVATIAGDEGNDNLSRDGIIKLSNGNFVILSDYDNFGGIQNVGTAMIINSVTGAVISTTALDTKDNIANVTGYPLTNGNFAVVSPPADNGTIVNAGAIMIINGTTGNIINTIYGDSASDLLGYGPSMALPNGNFVSGSTAYDDGGNTNAGVIYLINGTTGAVITKIVGGHAGDTIGSNGLVKFNTSSNFLIHSGMAQYNSLSQAGMIQLVNGTTGAIIQTFHGTSASEGLGAIVSTVTSQDHFYIINYAKNVSGNAIAGEVTEHDSSGALIRTIQGSQANLYLGGLGIEISSSGSILFSLGLADHAGLMYAGLFGIYPVN